MSNPLSTVNDKLEDGQGEYQLPPATKLLRSSDRSSARFGLVFRSVTLAIPFLIVYRQLSVDYGLLQYARVCII
jgi:hypothetical protein